MIKEYIYTSFLILTLGSFGISSVDKYTNVKYDTKDDFEAYDDYTETDKPEEGPQSKYD